MDVKHIVNEILSTKQSKELYIEKYPDFFEHYPVLSEKIFDPSFDKSTFNYMLNQREKITENKLTEHDASVKVGTLLVDKYVKPNMT